MGLFSGYSREHRPLGSYALLATASHENVRAGGEQGPLQLTSLGRVPLHQQDSHGFPRIGSARVTGVRETWEKPENRC